MDTKSSDNASAVAMQDSSTQSNSKLTTSIEALEEKVDAAVKLYDSTGVDSIVDDDELDYLSESSVDEADWYFSGETANRLKISLEYIMELRGVGSKLTLVGQKNQLGVWGCCKPPSRSRAVPWWESRGRRPQKLS